MATPPNAAAERQARLAAALRENLRKRKAQARAREDAARPEPEKPEGTTGEQPRDKAGA